MLPRVAVLMVCTLVSCSAERPDDGTGEAIGIEPEHKPATLMLELSIGDDPDPPAEYQFSDIKDILVGADGRIWVADGGQGSAMGLQSPQVRLYDSEGNFLRQVGRAGPGPGEYRDPAGLALLADGRVALRDLLIPNRITVFTAAGDFAETWPLGRGHAWLARTTNALQVDTGGVVWLPFSGRPSRADPRPAAAFLRVSPEGIVLDTVSLPPLPLDESELALVNVTTAAGSRTLMLVPNQPMNRWAWSPTGSIAVARTDRYHVEVFPPVPRSDRPAGGGESAVTRPGAVFTRELAPIPVPPAERAAAREQIVSRVIAAGGTANTPIPPLPEHKTPIRDFSFSDDGLLFIMVSMPSRHVDGSWTEDTAYDVFGAAGSFMGRMVVPASIRLHRIKHDRLYGVHRGPYGVESVRTYRVVWQ
jgi:hypothetical protein